MNDKKVEDPYVSEKVCDLRMKLLEEKIASLKKTVYIAAFTITSTLTIVQLILTLFK